MADTKRAAAHRRPCPERGVAAYRRTPEREQTILIGWPSDIGGRQHDNAALSVLYVGIKSQALTLLFNVAVQQQSCSSPEIQPSTWRRIASLHLAETLRPTALPHGMAARSTSRSRADCCCLCVWLGMSRDRRCGHHAAETPLHVCTAVRVPKYHCPEKKEIFHSHINTQTIFKFPDRRVAGCDFAFFVAVQHQTCSSQEIQPSTWMRIASLHLAENLRPTALPHGSALHL